MDCELCKLPFNLANRIPLELPCCNETICKICKEELVGSSQDDKFTCPIESCNEQTLKSAIFKMNKIAVKLLQKQEMKSTGIICEVHEGKEVKYYSWNHNNLVCQSCLLDSNKNHDVVRINKGNLQDYNKILLDKLRTELGRIQNQITEIESWQNNEATFTSNQYMEMMSSAQSIVLPWINDQEEKKKIKFKNNMPQPINGKIYQELSSNLLTDQDLKIIDSWFPQRVQLKLIYRASKDGWTPLDFHRYCDKEGPTLTVIRSQHNFIFGGFASKSWQFQGGHQEDDQAFIFSLTHKTKLNLKQENTNSKVLLFDIEHLSVFGGSNYYYDIKIGKDCNSKNASSCEIGTTYNLPDGIEYRTSEAKRYMAGSESFLVNEIEVFKVIY